MTKYIIGEYFSSGGATLYKNPSDQTLLGELLKQAQKVAWFWKVNMRTVIAYRTCLAIGVSSD